MSNIVVCKSCAKILHSKHEHNYVQCKCPNKTFADGGDGHHRRAGGESLDMILRCSTLAEAKRLAKTLSLKSTLKEATEPTFYDVMVKRLSKKRADQIDQSIRGFLKRRGGYPGNPGDIWNPDYCNAFGIMQGVAYALGFDGSNSAPGHPRHWFDKLVKEYPLQKQAN